MAYNRYRMREKFRRQYTFTKTKAFVGFVLSAVFSILLSAYFDRYGLIIWNQTKAVLFGSDDDAPRPTHVRVPAKRGNMKRN